MNEDYVVVQPPSFSFKPLWNSLLIAAVISLMYAVIPDPVPIVDEILVALSSATVAVIAGSAVAFTSHTKKIREWKGFPTEQEYKAELERYS